MKSTKPLTGCYKSARFRFVLNNEAKVEAFTPWHRFDKITQDDTDRFIRHYTTHPARKEHHKVYLVILEVTVDPDGHFNAYSENHAEAMKHFFRMGVNAVQTTLFDQQTF